VCILCYNYLKLHHKSSWQIVGQVTSQAPVFWRLKEGQEGEEGEEGVQ
jgi:hypothetical protein